jgi:hypothetical protein
MQRPLSQHGQDQEVSGSQGKVCVIWHWVPFGRRRIQAYPSLRGNAGQLSVR